MTTLKQHQAAMVDLLASGSGIPASASRLAHAMHDVLVYLVDGRNVPLSSVTGVEVIKYKPDATTPGLNEKALSKPVTATKMDSPAKWPLKAEQRIKQLNNTIQQLRDSNAKLREEISDLRGSKVPTVGDVFGQEQAGCRKPDTQMCEHEWKDDGRVFACKKCGVHPSDIGAEVNTVAKAPCDHAAYLVVTDGSAPWGTRECITCGAYF